MLPHVLMASYLQSSCHSVGAPRRYACTAGPEAKGHADTFVQTAEALHQHVLTLYDGTNMPRSDSTFVG